MISILLLSSLFEAFYFLPLHAKEFFSIKKNKTEHRKNDFWLKLDVLYEKFLGNLLRHKKRSLMLLVAFIILSTVGMLGLMKFKLFPEFDSTQIYLNGKIDVNSKLEDTEKVVTEIEKRLLTYYGKGEVSSITSVIGISFNADQTFETGKNLFHIFINLHEKAPENFFDKYLNPLLSLEYDGSDMIRKEKAQEIAKGTQKEVIASLREERLPNGEKRFSEINLFVPQTGIVGHDIEIGLNTIDEKQQLEAIAMLKRALQHIPGVFDVTDNATEGVKELKLRINEYGQMLGFNEAYVATVLKGSFLKGEYGKMFDTKGLIRVRIEDPDKDETMDIEAVKLTTPDGSKVVRLDEICDFIYKKSYVKIFKEDGDRVRTVIARVESKTILATEVMEKIKPLLEHFRKEGIKVIIKGEERENTQMKKEMSQAALIAVFLIFISLVWMFNSLVLPLIIVSTIPLSIVGALVGTYIMGINVTMPGVMGMIGLAGVVVNDGLIMLSFIKGAKDQREMLQKAGHRLRPILLTSITTVLGLFSMIFFASGQALIIQPMAISLGFGIAWATILNLYYVPLLYAVIYGVEADHTVRGSSSTP
jgi:multidrug efflux pump subunit AcrB